MRGFLYDKDMTEWELPLLYDWEVCHGTGETCDYFECSFPYEKGMLPKLAEAVYFKGVNNGDTVFYGITDEYTLLCDGDGSRVTLRGRSMAGILMDNEAEAAGYGSLSLDTVLKRHVMPYFYGPVERRSMPVLHRFDVSSGESEWSVLSHFCRYSCGVQPRFSKDGVLLLNDKPGTVRSFDESCPVFSVRRRDCRYGLISSVLVKNRFTGASYTVHNEKFEKRGGCSRRVLNVPRSTRADAMRYTGEYQIRESERGRSIIELGLCTQFAGFPGDVAELSFPQLGIEGSFRVVKSRC